jgi:hypothetical protein
VLLKTYQQNLTSHVFNNTKGSAQVKAQKPATPDDDPFWTETYVGLCDKLI